VFSARTQAYNNIIFGLSQTTRLTVDGSLGARVLSNQPCNEIAIEFRIAIDVSFQQVKVRKHGSDDLDKLSTVANPGRLKR
jgi:hypothetical protein